VASDYAYYKASLVNQKNCHRVNIKNPENKHKKSGIEKKLLFGGMPHQHFIL
jgi:hypothetical protein